MLSEIVDYLFCYADNLDSLSTQIESLWLAKVNVTNEN